MEPEQKEVKKSFSISTPAAILSAGALIAVAILFTNGSGAARTDRGAYAGGPGKETTVLPKLELRSDDHVNGDPSKAAVLLYEYSDSDCPFCARFHPITKQIKQEYGEKIAIVYRHYPLEGLHPYAKSEALALECVADIGGNTAFWTYLDSLFTVSLSQDANDGKKVDTEIFTTLAQTAGVDATAFKTCFVTKKFEQKVESQAAEAIALGAEGTPYSIVVNQKTGKQIAIPGAYPIEEVRKFIDSIL